MGCSDHLLNTKPFLWWWNWRGMFLGMYAASKLEYIPSNCFIMFLFCFVLLEYHNQSIKKLTSASLLFNRFIKVCQDQPPSINMIYLWGKITSGLHTKYVKYEWFWHSDCNYHLFNVVYYYNLFFRVLIHSFCQIILQKKIFFQLCLHDGKSLID